MEKLSELEDPRQPSNGTRHDFREILVIAVCAMLSDADSFEDIALWGRLKADWLRRFLVLKSGIPSQDTFLRVFRVLDPKQFEAVFRRWVGGIVGALDGVVAVDGKTLRRSADGDAPPVHMVSAFSTELGLVLGQEKVAGKSNEITAIPELLEALHIKGLLVSIDAMCQGEPNFPHLWESEIPHPVQASASSGRTRPAFNFSFSRYELPRMFSVTA